MKKAHLTQRTLKLGDGSEFVLPVQLFDNPEQAARLGQEMQHGMSKMLDCHLVHITGAGQADDTGVTLRQFLVDLGLLGFKHSTRPLDVEGAPLIHVTGPGFIPLPESRG